MTEPTTPGWWDGHHEQINGKSEQIEAEFVEIMQALFPHRTARGVTFNELNDNSILEFPFSASISVYMTGLIP